MTPLAIVTALLVVVLQVSSVEVVKGQCTWTTADNYTLDLSDLGFVQTPYSNWVFLIEMCSDSLGCDSDKVMALQENSNSGTCTAYLALWDSGLEPTFSSEDGGTWTFNYGNGESTNCDNNVNRKLNLHFVCASELDEYVTESAVGSCVYDWYIYTPYACIGSVPTTTYSPYDNTTTCAWTTDNGYTLDLSSLAGTMTGYEDADNDKYYYYSPCVNGVVCYQQGTATNAMMTQTDENGVCISYLAQFDGSDIDKQNATEPIYSNGVFSFDYKNGEICQGTNRQTFLAWQCDKSKNGEGESLWEIVSVSEVVSCVYQVVINSSLACVTNTTSTGLMIDNHQSWREKA